MTTTELILTYLEIWNVRGAAARESLMKSALADDSIYTDPDHAALRGHAALSEAIGRAQENFGDLRFSLGEVIGVHHDRALFTWRLGTAASGYDVVELSGGRIRSIVGFFT